MKFKLIILVAFISIMFVGCTKDPKYSITLNEESIVLAEEELHELNVVKSHNEIVLLWESENNSIATVDNGVVRGIKKGSTKIKVSIKGTNIFKEVEVSVEEKLILSVSKEEIVIDQDEDYKIEAVVNKTGNDLVWESLNKDIATVDNGIVTGVNVGETKIKVSIKDTDVYKEVNVKVNEKLTLTLSEQNVNINVRDTLQLNAYINKPGYELVWESSNQNVVTVDNGKITGISEGSAIIKVKVINTDIEKEVIITINPKPMSIYKVSSYEELDNLLKGEDLYPNDKIIITNEITLDEVYFNIPIKLELENNLIVNKINVSITNGDFIINGNYNNLVVNDLFNVKGDIQINALTVNGDITLKSYSSLIIDINSITKNILLENEASNIKVENYGKINQINLSNVVYTSNEVAVEVIMGGSTTNKENAIVLSNDANVSNTKISKLSDGEYFWITEVQGFTNFDIYENGIRNVIRDKNELDKVIVKLDNKNIDLEKALTLFKTNNPDFVIGNVEIINTNNNTLDNDDFIYLNNNLNSIHTLDLLNSRFLNDKIPSEALINKKTLQNVILPEGLIEIGAKAFFQTSIRKIVIPSTVLRVGEDAFGYSLTNEVNIEEVHVLNPKPLGAEFVYGFSPHAFFFVPSGKTDEFRNVWINYRKQAGYGYYTYEKKVFNESNFIDGYYVREVEGGAEIVLYLGSNFEGNIIKEEFFINGKLLNTVSVGENAFRFARNITNTPVSLVFPDSVKYIGKFAFYEFGIISELDLNNVEKVDANAFQYINYTFTVIKSPNLKTVGEYAFNGLAKVTFIDVSKLEHLADHAFQSMRSISVFNMPNLKYMGTGAIGDCINLETLILGAIEYCGSWALNGNGKLSVIDFTHNLDIKIEPHFGPGWNSTKAIFYVNADVKDYFITHFSGFSGFNLDNIKTK